MSASLGFRREEAVVDELVNRWIATLARVRLITYLN
jgi:hypothetical protein